MTPGWHDSWLWLALAGGRLEEAAESCGEAAERLCPEAGIAEKLIIAGWYLFTSHLTPEMLGKQILQRILGSSGLLKRSQHSQGCARGEMVTFDS